MFPRRLTVAALAVSAFAVSAPAAPAAVPSPDAPVVFNSGHAQLPAGLPPLNRVIDRGPEPPAPPTPAPPVVTPPAQPPRPTPTPRGTQPQPKRATPVANKRCKKAKRGKGKRCTKRSAKRRVRARASAGGVGRLVTSTVWCWDRNDANVRPGVSSTMEIVNEPQIFAADATAGTDWQYAVEQTVLLQWNGAEWVEAGAGAIVWGAVNDTSGSYETTWTDLNTGQKYARLGTGALFGASGYWAVAQRVDWFDGNTLQFEGGQYRFAQHGFMTDTFVANAASPNWCGFYS